MIDTASRPSTQAGMPACKVNQAVNQHNQKLHKDIPTKHKNHTSKQTNNSTSLQRQSLASTCSYWGFGSHVCPCSVCTVSGTLCRRTQKSKKKSLRFVATLSSNSLQTHKPNSLIEVTFVLACFHFLVLSKGKKSVKTTHGRENPLRKCMHITM